MLGRHARQEGRENERARRPLRGSYDREAGSGSRGRHDHGRHASGLRSRQADLGSEDALLGGECVHPELDGGSRSCPDGSQVCEEGDSASHGPQYSLAAGRLPL